MARDVSRWLSTCQFDPLIDQSSFCCKTSRNCRDSALGHVILDLHACAAEHAKAVEIADERPVGIPSRIIPRRGFRELQQGGVAAHHHRGMTDVRRKYP